MKIYLIFILMIALPGYAKGESDTQSHLDLLFNGISGKHKEFQGRDNAFHYIEKWEDRYSNFVDFKKLNTNINESIKTIVNPSLQNNKTLELTEKAQESSRLFVMPTLIKKIAESYIDLRNTPRKTGLCKNDLISDFCIISGSNEVIKIKYLTIDVVELVYNNHKSQKKYIISIYNDNDIWKIFNIEHELSEQYIAYLIMVLK